MKGSEGKRNRILFLIAAVLIAAAVIVLLASFYQEKSRSDKREAVLKGLQKALPEEQSVFVPYENKTKKSEDSSDTERMEMMSIDGCSCVGILVIKDLGRSWPVGSMYEDRKTMPCHSEGLPEEENFRIRGIGRYYDFKDISGLRAGADVDFISVDGTKYEYEVTGIDESGNMSGSKCDLMLWYSKGKNNRMMIRCDFRDQ
ncbi:MAG: hypothetical protein ACI4LM_02390 [Anaerovoracaceae bacterium]